jgi:hypothetical protein
VTNQSRFVSTMITGAGLAVVFCAVRLALISRAKPALMPQRRIAPRARVVDRAAPIEPLSLDLADLFDGSASPMAAQAVAPAKT